MLNFKEFIETDSISEKTISHAAYVVNGVFSKLKSLKGDEREGILTPADIDVIKATKIGTVTSDVSKWSRVNLRSNYPTTRKVIIKLTDYGKKREADWKKANENSIKESVLNEVFEQPYPFHLEKVSPQSYVAEATIAKGRFLYIFFATYNHTPNEWTLYFKVDYSMEITGEGDAYRIMATVIAAINEFIRVCDEPFDSLHFISINEKGKTSRTKLYRAMLKRFAKERGDFTFIEDRYSVVGSSGSEFILKKKEFITHA